MNKNKLCLGTVQFGMEYGINNALGRKPKQEECYSILDEAIKNNILCFDTASGYGDAENILGSYEGFKTSSVRIISKIRPIDISVECYEDYILNECRQTIEKLSTKKLYGYLFHSANDMYNKNIFDSMLLCKKNGLTDNIGVSVYNPQDALYAVNLEEIDFIQVPYNVLDQRLNQYNFFEIAKSNGKVIFARSAFLQGLLVMDMEDVRKKFPKALKYIIDFENICSKHGFCRKEAAFMFSYLNNNIDYVVFGVDNVEQLKENLQYIDKIDYFDECYKELLRSFNDIEESIVNPCLWK